MRTLVVVVVVVAFAAPAAAQQQPPFPGGLWDISPTLITDADRTALRGITYLGEHERHMWLMRENVWTNGHYTVHVFDVAFDRRRVEFQVHPELGDQAAARAEVETYAPMIGRLPWALREHLREVEIQQQGRGWTARAYDRDPSAGSINIQQSAAAQHAPMITREPLPNGRGVASMASRKKFFSMKPSTCR